MFDMYKYQIGDYLRLQHEIFNTTRPFTGKVVAYTKDPVRGYIVEVPFDERRILPNNSLISGDDSRGYVNRFDKFNDSGKAFLEVYDECVTDRLSIYRTGEVFSQNNRTFRVRELSMHFYYNQEYLLDEILDGGRVKPCVYSLADIDRLPPPSQENHANSGATPQNGTTRVREIHYVEDLKANESRIVCRSMEEVHSLLGLLHTFGFKWNTEHQLIARGGHVMERTWNNINDYVSSKGFITFTLYSYNGITINDVLRPTDLNYSDIFIQSRGYFAPTSPTPF